MNDVKATSQMNVEDVLSVALSQMKVQEDVLMLRMENTDLKKELDKQTKIIEELNQHITELKHRCECMRCCENCRFFDFAENDCSCTKECTGFSQWAF